MATAPKRPAKKTVPPNPDRLAATASPVQDLSELKQGVLSLAERVNQLSSALSTVNEIQRQVMLTDRRSKAAERQTQDIQEVLIPRSEHEKRWKKEQEELIRTRLSIRRQTYLVATTFFGLAMLALIVTTSLLYRDIHAQQTIRHDQNIQRCLQGNAFRTGDLSLWNKVIALSQTPTQPLTPAEQTAAKQKVQDFEKFLHKHDALQNCRKVH